MDLVLAGIAFTLLRDLRQESGKIYQYLEDKDLLIIGGGLVVDGGKRLESKPNFSLDLEG